MAEVSSLELCQSTILHLGEQLVRFAEDYTLLCYAVQTSVIRSCRSG